MSILNISLLHELANHFTVENNAEYHKLNQLLSSADRFKDDWQQGELFVVVKHHADTPQRDAPARMLYAVNYQDAYSRCAFMLDTDKGDGVTHKLYEVCSLDGWNGSDVGSIKVTDGKVEFVTDYSKIALNAYIACDLPGKVLSVVRKQSGVVQVFYAGIMWVESDSVELALAHIGKQIDKYRASLSGQQKKWKSK